MNIKKPKIVLSYGNIRITAHRITPDLYEEMGIDVEDVGSWIDDTFEVVTYWKLPGVLSNKDLEFIKTLEHDRFITLPFGQYKIEEVITKKEKSNTYIPKDFSSYTTVPINHV